VSLRSNVLVSLSSLGVPVLELSAEPSLEVGVSSMGTDVREIEETGFFWFDAGTD